jgi:hypothetical protein
VRRPIIEGQAVNKTGTPEPNRGRALLGLLAIMALIVAVLFIMHRLNQAARIQDCVASGRTNCAPIEAPATRG